MALVVKDRVQETSTTTGTGTLTLDGAVSGFQTFSSAIGNTNTTYYSIVNGAEWEVGLGTVAAGTLARDTVLESSNGGTAVNFSAGTKNVFCTYPAEKAVIQDQSGKVGIGTNTPSTNLEVYGSEPTARVYVDNTGYAGMLQIANTSNYMLVGKDRDGSAGWYGNAGQYIIACNGAFPLDFYTNGTKRMSITSAGGVSFGTSATAYGTSGQVLTSNGNAAPTWADAGIQRGTAVASTSGTSIDFTSIPSWVKRITVMFNGVSLSGASQIQVQLGDSGGIETTGYVSGAWVYNAGTTSTSGLLCTGGFVAAWTYTGLAIITNITGNVWVSSSNGANSSNLAQGAGSKTLSGTLDRVRITTVNGTDTFDAGSINILYE